MRACQSNGAIAAPKVANIELSCEPPAAKASLFWNEGDWRMAERWCRESLRREPAYGRAHAILAKTLEAKRMALEVHRYRDERAFE